MAVDGRLEFIEKEMYVIQPYISSYIIYIPMILSIMWNIQLTDNLGL